ncbi:MAG: hypothetical protein J5674_01965 [Candidatus Methanomethylophilaceae archaeon]|nr:hypothetical protein [Candidatus Methanomethylophilaceae archaeon]
MKGKQVIPTAKRWEFDELMEYLQSRWDEGFSPKPVKFDHRPVIGTYMVLPGTRRFCVMIYVNAKGVVLITYPTDEEFAIRLIDDIPGKSTLAGIAALSRCFDREKDRKGPAEEMLLKYTEYVRSLLEEDG